MADKVWLWIDPTRRCNIACSLCYTRRDHAAEDLDADRLGRMLDQVEQDTGAAVQELTFNWRGEPLMNPRFPELLAMVMARRSGFPVQFHTNAMLLTRRLAARVIAAAGDCTIYLSIDGGSRASHEANRGAGTYDRAIAGAWQLLDARGAAPRPRIVLYQLDLRERRAAYDDEFLRLARSVDAWQRVSPILPSGDDLALPRQPETDGGAAMVSDWADVPPAAQLPAGPCFWAGNAVCVSPAGEAFVCLLGRHGSGRVGNLCSEPLSALVRRARRFRELILAAGRQNVPHCAGCRKCEGDTRPPRPSANLQLLEAAR